MEKQSRCPAIMLYDDTVLRGSVLIRVIHLLVALSDRFHNAGTFFLIGIITFLFLAL